MNEHNEESIILVDVIILLFLYVLVSIATVGNQKLIVNVTKS